MDRNILNTELGNALAEDAAITKKIDGAMKNTISKKFEELDRASKAFTSALLKAAEETLHLRRILDAFVVALDMSEITALCEDDIEAEEKIEEINTGSEFINNVTSINNTQDIEGAKKEVHDDGYKWDGK